MDGDRGPFSEVVRAAARQIAGRSGLSPEHPRVQWEAMVNWGPAIEELALPVIWRWHRAHGETRRCSCGSRCCRADTTWRSCPMTPSTGSIRRKVMIPPPHLDELRHGICFCSTHCPSSPHHEQACCDAVWCRCGCHEKEYRAFWDSQRALDDAPPTEAAR
jgi:hypothetical protein